MFLRLCVLVFSLNLLALGQSPCLAEPVPPPALHTVRILLVDANRPQENLREVTRALPLVGNQRIGSAVHWPSSMALNGNPLFERYEGGKLTVRLPIRTIELPSGDYTLFPGQHTFTVGADGALTSRDPEILIDGRDIRLKSYPVVIQVVDGEEPGPFSARRLAGAFTVTIEQKVKVPQPKPGEPGEKSVDVQLVPEAGTFAPLTLYLPANPNDFPYRVKPYGVSFQVIDGQVRLIAPEGRSLAAEADCLDIGVPTRSVEITLNTRELRTIRARMKGLEVDGNLELTGKARHGGVPETTKRFRGQIAARMDPVELLAGDRGSSLATRIDCSFTEFRQMAIQVENTVRDTDAASLFMVEYNDRALVPGTWHTMRVSAVDVAKAAAPNPQVAAFLRPNGTPNAPWQTLECERTGDFVERAVSTTETRTPEAGESTTEWRNPVSATVRFRVPALAMGVYDVLVAMDDPVPGPEARLSVSRLALVVPPDIPGALGFFTRKGRDAFCLGEDIRIGLAARSDRPWPAGGPQVTVSGPNGSRAILSLTRPTRTNDRLTFFLRLTPDVTQNLSPGTYTLQAEWASLLPATRAIDLVDPAPSTHFMSIMPGKYSSLGDVYHRALRADFDDPDGAERLVRFARRIGHNQLDLMHYSTDRTKRFPSIQEQLYPKYPTMPPAESFYRPTPRDRILNEGVRSGIGINDTLITFNDNHAPRYIEPLLRCTERWIALEAQSMKHSPAARGITFYDELYATGLTVPGGQQEAFQRLAKAAYEDRHGIAPAQIVKDIARFAERPKGRRDLKALDAYLSWYRLLDEGWSDMNRRLQTSSKRVMPNLRNTTRHRVWGTPGYTLDGEHGYFPAVMSPLDIFGFVTYSDNAGGWPLTHALMADAYGFHPRKPKVLTIPFAISSDSGEYLQQNFFSGLSQSIHGAAFYAQPGLDPSGPWTRIAEANRDLFSGIVQRYGDLFLALEPAYRQVAIHYSWRGQILSPLKQFAMVSHKVEGLWISCLRAGYPADLLYDEDIAAGRASDYRIVLVPGIEFEEELGEEILARFRDLIAAGKTIIVEKGSKLAIEGVTVMDDTEWDEFYQPLYQSAGWDDELQKTFDLTETLTAKIKAFLGRYVRPAADHSMTVGPDWLRSGETWYLVVPNFEDPMFSYLHRQRLVAPARPALKVYDKPAVCYDVLEMQQVPLTRDGESLAFEADMLHASGKLYAFLKRPIGGVLLESTASPAPGDDLAVRVQAFDDAGETIRGAVPMELALRDPQGRETVRYRAATPAICERFRIPDNAAPGEWRLTARELIAGHEATRPFRITPRGPSLRLAEDDRSVLVHDPDLTRRILSGMSRAVSPIDDPKGAAAGLVSRLQPEFRAHGIELLPAPPQDIAIPNEVYSTEGIYNEYSHWDGRLVGPTFHVDEPVILLDLQGTHPWMAHLLRHGLMLDIPSPHNPGPGRAIIVPVPQAFHTRKDTIVVSSGDLAGLERGIRALLAPDPAARLPYPLLATPEPLTGDEKMFSSLTAVRGTAVRATSTRRLAHMENTVTAMAVNPANGHVIAGTRGYGDNLFCVDMEGKKVWSRHISEYDVHRLEITPDGKFLFASCLFDDRTYLLDPADGTVRWSLVNVPKKQIAHNHEGYASSYSHPTVFPAAQKLVLRHPGRATILGFDGKLVTHAAIPAAASGPAFSPDVTHYATVEQVDHRETYQPPPIQGKEQPAKEIAVAYDHLRVYRVNDGTQIADAVLGKVSFEPHQVTWPHPAGPVVCRFGRAESFRPDGRRLGPADAPPAPGTAYTVDGDAVLHAVDSPGQEKWTRSLADPSPDTGAPGECVLASWRDHGVVVGTSRGDIVAVGSDGKIAWRVRLGAWNSPRGDYSTFVAEARRQNRDVSEDIWPASTDQDGDLDATVKMGMNRLTNAGFENASGGWSTDPDTDLPRETQATEGKFSLRVGERMIAQDIRQHICPMATYVLEFHYRPVREGAVLVAGTLLDGGERVPSSVRFGGDTARWHFGRMACKTHDTTTSLSVGFFADGGEVLLDNVRLRQVRWPSTNHMQNLALHRNRPLWVESFRIAYRGAPETIKDQLGNKVYVPILPELGGRAVFMDGTLLQNGRLNDTKSRWYMYESPTYVELIWQKPAWVSHLAFYFHQHYPDRVMPSFFISALNPETKKWERLAHVEGNRRLFLVLRFPPVFTERIRIEEDNIHPLQRTLTEIEAYGPLGGQEAATGFSTDPDAFPMYMGGPDHVDRRNVPDLLGEFRFSASVIPVPSTDSLIAASTGTGPAVADGRYYLGSNHGHVIANDIGKPVRDASISRPTRWGFLTPPTLYGGRLLLGSAGGQIHCLRADNAELLYQTATGGRIYAAPLPHGDDLFVASLDGLLYRLDLANGSVLWSVDLGGELRASPAIASNTVVAVTTQGAVVAVDAERGAIAWKQPVAPESVGSPAIDAGRVYLGDRAGTVHCLDLANGKPVWQRETGMTIETGPTLRNGSLFIVNLDGELLRMDQAAGNLIWRTPLGAESSLEPAASATQVLVASTNGIHVLRQSDGKPDDRFIHNKSPGRLSLVERPDQGTFTVVGFCVYRGSLVLTCYPQKGGPIYLNQHGWALQNVTLGVATPVPPETKEGKK